MTYLRLTFALGLAALTAACDKKAEAPASKDSSQPISATSSSMPGTMAMEPSAAAAIEAKGHGIVTAIDKTASMITLSHDAIPEAKWPAMTMGFKAAPGVTDAVAVGDKVDFDITIKGSAGEVTAIHKR
ncbi:MULTISPECIES: copper-binding protein [unclassified Novosphingobium]|uniref:copper-binding protein n=1 Tax=unclassified Novosphingobium TaxID=2644732 RepID=UPI00146CEC1F|nr:MULTISPECIES: copper-binding protein [unclassified Novosphingobium]NMN06816.1 Cu/Ag efflux protein CusF [Novosphingobium sp. SG919]NMN88734.1 Cu/Ag efflux protein CusF [Novosphingobium sp. SG916]